jgi:hypothetical protein
MRTASGEIRLVQTRDNSGVYTTATSLKDYQRQEERTIVEAQQPPPAADGAEHAL